MKPFPVRAYVIRLAPLLALWFGAAAIVVDSNIRDVEKDLAQYGTAYLNHLDKEMMSSENILMGFSALFGAVGDTNPALASRYAKQVIAANPKILALEIVQAVARNQLVAFVAKKRRNGIPNFTVKSFSYDSDRKLQALQEKAVYYPIMFMEPMPPDAEDILGLDAESVPFLQQAMNKSLQRRTPVASHPFRLVEGNLAYVVFFPISQTFRREDSHLADTTQNELLVGMVIDTSKMAEPVKFPPFNGGTVIVYHRDFAPDNPNGQLLKISGKARSPIETAVFPTFVYKNSLATMGEPFALMVKRQVGWSDLSLGPLALIALFALMSSLTLVAYLKARQQDRVAQSENQNRLWQLANHDALTGLPNRMLLMDRGTQLLARMLRQNMGLAVLFLDIDDFKKVNDQFGYEFGDRLLKFVAERLRAAARMDDTVARMSSDEFVILIEGVENRESLGLIKKKIQQKLSDGFLIEGQLIHVRTSIGIAIFPEDGDSVEALLKQADMRMHADKKARTVKLHLV